MNNFSTTSYLDKGVRGMQDLVISTNSSVKSCYSVGWYSTSVTPNVTSQISYYPKPAIIWSNPTNYKCMVVEPNSSSNYSNNIRQSCILPKPERQFSAVNNLLPNFLMSPHLKMPHGQAQKRVRVPNSEFVAEIIGKQGLFLINQSITINTIYTS